ncbi:hypothetical protein FF38_04082 [Lucilia cuprina]|uniref:Uncharacterized protein n=1 Tax=Lucilia cuprina TaxID=7375 RepID=A0A0L0BRR9_LUCCU|nr:hypothetical protein CVS40_7422 [Lucilia cuprina]KNC22775.1 hypothetical protein FF38_04082 [Lucilia cuprina]
MIMGSCLGRNSSNNFNSNKSTSSLMSSCLGRQSTDDQDLDLVSNLSDSYRKHNIIFRIWNFKRKKKSSHYLDKFWQHQDTNYAKLNNGNQIESYSDIQLQNLDVNNLLITSGHTKETAVNYLPSRVPSSRASSSLDLEWEHEYSQIRHFNQHLLKQKSQMQPQQNIGQFSMMMAAGCTTKDETSADESWQYMNQDEDQSMASLSSLAAVPDALNATNKNKERYSEKRSLLKSNSRVMLRTGSITRNSSHNSWSHISTPESLEWDIDEDQQQQLKMEDDNLDHETLKLLHQIEQLKNRVLYETGEGLYDILDNGDYDYVGNGIRTTGTFSRTNCFQLGDSDGENGNYS